MLVLVLHSSRNLVTGQFFYFKKKTGQFWNSDFWRCHGGIAGMSCNFCRYVAVGRRICQEAIGRRICQVAVSSMNL